jgi:hypothetical protein
MPRPAPSTVEEALAWEAEQRPRAGIAALLSGLLVLAAGLWTSNVFKDFPPVYLLDSLRDAAGQRLTDGRHGLRTAQIRFYDDHAVELLVGTVAQVLGFLLILVVLGYIYRATRARRPEISIAGLIAAVAGPVLFAVGGLVQQIVVMQRASDYVAKGDFTTPAAHDALRGGVLVAAQFLQQMGVLVLAIAFVIVSLNAMRAGLLTRFMGILGIIVGALFVLPLGSGLPIVQCFWLIAAGVLILGKWPSGRPPAWETGRAQPWPTQQELREARGRQRAEIRDEATPDRADDAADKPRPQASSKKKKRRR